MIYAKRKVGDIVIGRLAVGRSKIALRIDEVINQRGWVDNPIPAYIVTDISNLFGMGGYLINEKSIESL